MLECKSLDDIGSAHDITRRSGTPVVIVSFYLANPSQFAIEYDWGGRTIDDSCWQVARYDSVDSIWGHPELAALAAKLHS